MARAFVTDAGVVNVVLVTAPVESETEGLDRVAAKLN